jgi:hypothetical protein
VLNRLFTRDLLRERTERELSELRLEFVLRRKSVRKELSSEGIGSDMPISVPVDLRKVFCATFSPGGGLLCRCRRMPTVMRRAATAPNMAPGKKPARIALVGNEGQDDSALAADRFPLEAV